MKTPDKVYLATTQAIIDMAGDFAGVAHETSKDIINPIEYLKKDAIIIKLKMQQDKCVFRSTYWDFWQAVINEIKAI